MESSWKKLGPWATTGGILAVVGLGIWFAGNTDSHRPLWADLLLAVLGTTVWPIMMGIPYRTSLMTPDGAVTVVAAMATNVLLYAVLGWVWNWSGAMRAAGRTLVTASLTGWTLYNLWWMVQAMWAQ